MTNIVIIDDNENQLNYIEEKVLLFNNKDITIQKFQNENIFLENLYTIPEYSIFFVDIVLNEKTGIEIAKHINNKIRGSIIIFISSYLDKVVDIYDAQHYYFIYKPELEKRLPIVLMKAINSLNELKKTLPLNLKGKTVLVHPTDILFLERQKHITLINVTNEKIQSSQKLDEFLERLPSYFIRCHRSYAVNMQCVKEIKRDEFILNDKTIIPISRAFQKQVHEQFQDFLMGNL